MWNIIKGEWQKLRRCQILLVGIVALALCIPVAVNKWKMRQAYSEEGGEE